MSSPETTAIPLAADEASTVPRSTFASSWRSVAACAGLDKRARNRLISASQSGGKESSSSSRARRGGRRREASRWRWPESSRRRAFPPPSGAAARPCFAGTATARREHVELCIADTETEAERSREDADSAFACLHPFARSKCVRAVEREQESDLFIFLFASLALTLNSRRSCRRRRIRLSLSLSSFDSHRLSLAFFRDSRVHSEHEPNSELGSPLGSPRTLVLRAQQEQEKKGFSRWLKW